MRSAADLTARARIRNSALELFGEIGFHRATIRSIAAHAGTSPGLVLHFFGSKDGLRAACDAYVVDEWLADHDTNRVTDLNAKVQEWLSDVDSFRPLVGYLRHTLIDPSPASSELFDRLVRQSRGTLEEGQRRGTVRPLRDPEATALVIVLYKLAPLLLQEHVARHLGADYLSAESVRRLSLPILEIFTHGVYTRDDVLAATEAAFDAQEGRP